MPRYFLHLHECGDVTRDLEGVELDGLDAAHGKATTAAREILCAEVIDGRLCLNCYILVADEADKELFRIDFRDAIAITGI